MKRDADVLQCLTIFFVLIYFQQENSFIGALVTSTILFSAIIAPLARLAAISSLDSRKNRGRCVPRVGLVLLL
jgi:hypothetical protein